MTRFLPAWLTAHRAVLLGLVALVICAFVVSAVDAEFAPRPDALVLSLVLVVVVTGAVTYLGAAIVRVPPNSDSWLITALILFFVLPGAADSASVTTVIVGSAVAAASKYVLVWRRRLIVNPAAAGAVVCYGLGYAGVGSIGFPTWWIAAQPMLIPMVVIGVVVVTALYEWPLVATFLVAALVTIGVVALIDGTGDLSLWLISSPMFFAATFMLPEPLTSPSTRVHRLIYGALVGVLMYCQQSIPVTDAFTLEFVPEIALLIGCLYAFIVRLSAGTARRIPLDVSSVDALAEHTFGVRLAADGGAPRFRPGQWATLSAPRWSAPLWNSSRRVFSFANAPGARATEFAFTTGAGPSPYKGALIDGSTSRVWIDNIGGDFVTGSDAVPGDHDIVLFASASASRRSCRCCGPRRRPARISPRSPSSTPCAPTAVRSTPMSSKGCAGKVSAWWSPSTPISPPAMPTRSVSRICSPSTPTTAPSTITSPAAPTSSSGSGQRSRPPILTPARYEPTPSSATEWAQISRERAQNHRERARNHRERARSRRERARNHRERAQISRERARNHREWAQPMSDLTKNVRFAGFSARRRTK